MANVLTLYQNEAELASYHADEIRAAKSVTRFAITKTTQTIPYQDNAFDVVYLATSSAELHSDALLREVFRVLRSNGTFMMTEKLSSERRRDVVEDALLFAGFMEWQIDCLSSDTIEIKTQKPEWAGAAFAVATQEATLVAKPPKSLDIWTNPDADDGNVEYEDEDAILEDEDITPSKKYDDCGSGKKGRKSCKNCTCGRAEEETSTKPKPAVAAPQTTSASSAPTAAPKRLTSVDTNDLPKSGCGNCTLGDAFRCTGCPYMGLPPFKPGEKIQVSLSDDI